MKRIVFDWSLRRGVVAIVISEDGGEDVKWPSTRAMLDSLKEPHEIICESTFESYILEDRRDFASRCEKEGHILRTLPPRLTPRNRRSMGLIKSDENDATAMACLALEESRLSIYHEPDVAKVSRHDRANRRLMLLRARGLKEEWAQGFASKLPPFKDQDETRRKALGDAFEEKAKNHRNGWVDGRDYNLIKVAAVAAAAEECPTQKDFDQVSGLYAHAYPSQIRADLMHWGWAGGSQRPRLVKEIDPSGETGKLVPVVPSRRKDGLTLTEYRRELRWLYRNIRKIIAQDTSA